MINKVSDAILLTEMPQVSMMELVQGIRSGDFLASFPTDTVPALAARLDRATLIFEAKQRDRGKPLILMAAALESLWDYVIGRPEERQIWQQMAERHLPGALTLVLPASSLVPVAMNPVDPTTIGVRVPNHPIAQAILAKTGPLATTSTNRSGQPPLQTMAEIETQFPAVLTLISSELQKFSTVSPSGGIPSTVAKWTGQTWQILRQGALELSQ